MLTVSTRIGWRKRREGKRQTRRRKKREGEKRGEERRKRREGEENGEEVKEEEEGGRKRMGRRRRS